MKHLLLCALITSIPAFADSKTEENETMGKIKANLEEIKKSLKETEKSVKEHAEKQSKRLSEEVSDGTDSGLEFTQKALGSISAELKELEAKVRGLREEKNKAKKK